jgi:hypothetical protein
LPCACATLAVAALVACGGGDEAPEPRCGGTPPEEGATYANADVAFATGPGGALQADRSEGELPWFAKAGLLVRGSDPVVVGVPDGQDVVRIVGWGGAPEELRTATIVESAPACESDWTAYPGGLAFSGRRCVRLRVEGPGEQSGTAVLGLRRDCPD